MGSRLYRTIELSQEQSYQNETGAPAPISIDEAIGRLGYGRFQVRVMVAAGLCFAADAMEVLLLSFLAVVLQVEWGLSSKDTAFLTSTVFVGALLGTLVLGPLGDMIGRRPVFILAALIISVFGIATAFCDTFFHMSVARSLVGFGVGGLTVPFDTLAELLPTDYRGKNLLYIEYFWTAGTLLVPLFAYAAIGNGESADTNGWRNFVVLCALPCIVSVLLGTFLVPESPRWLISVGKQEKAMKVLRYAAQVNRLNPDVVYPEGTTLKAEKPEDSTVCELFAPVWRRITINLWASWCGMAFLYYGIILACTLVFSTESDDTQDPTFDFDYQALFISCSAEFFGTTFAILLVDRVGRIPLQAMSFLIGGISVFILVLTSARNVQIGLAFFARWFMMSGTCTAWVGTAEILPTEIRTTGHSTANAVARVGGFVAPFVVQEGTSRTVIAISMIVAALMATVAVRGLPETKGKAMGAIRWEEDDTESTGDESEDERGHELT